MATQRQIVEESPEIKARKLGLMDTAKELADTPLDLPEYEVADHYYDNASIPMYFKVVEDGSLHGGGVEFVTERPVIGRQVDGALDSLEECNLDECNSVDESCGVHIHINAIDFGFRELKSLPT